jgi:two-component system, chemotaxis family, CheB/CheR fusion protein
MIAETDNHKKNFPIVAIGASAGGLEAVKELFTFLPANTGMAFVYVQHLNPDIKSNLPSIIGRITSMPVTEATSKVKIEPNHLYIIPPGKEITLTDGILNLKPQRKERTEIKPIDLFFTSLAEGKLEASIGILLSGTGKDGTAGLKAIKTAGGLTFAQNNSAQFSNMPDSAIQEGIVDKILTPKQIAEYLANLSSKSNIIQQLTVEGPKETGLEEEELEPVLKVLKKETRVDFIHYKENTIRRRILRRMLLQQIDNLEEYHQFLKQHPTEVNLLFNDLLINVTSFFRDRDTIDYLKKTVIPKIVSRKAAYDPIRIWVPACSTGEEAYTLAILFSEFFTEKTKSNQIQIFASDLSELAITKARLGVYAANEVLNLEPGIIDRYFTKIDGSFRVNKKIRDLCIFAPHNVFKDPPFSKMDLISCCNLMIYLDAVLQKKVLNRLHYALNTDSFLVLGKSETIGSNTQLFSLLDKKYKVYIKKNDVSNNTSIEITYQLPEYERPEVKFKTNNQTLKAHNHNDLEKLVDRILLNSFVPASVVINNDLEILQFKGSTGIFLEPAPGKASLNLLKMVKSNLAFDLRNAVHKAQKENKPVIKTGLDFGSEKKNSVVNIQVIPLKSGSDDPLYLVVFEEIHVPENLAIKGTASKDKIVKQLQDELVQVKEDMRSIIEEHESSNEELQSANEEILSSNEELQSINEELETTKEELESSNEELMTINSELQIRNEQLTESFEYAEIIYDTIREGTIILNRDLRIEKINTAFERIFNVSEKEIVGYPFFEVKDQLFNVPELRKLVEQSIFQTNQYAGLHVLHNFKGIGEKHLIINACKVLKQTHREQILLLAIDDITAINKE